MLDRLRHDLELKKQIVAVAFIATIVVCLESVLFFGIVTPEVTRNLRRMLQTDPDNAFLKEDPVAQAFLRCMLGITQEREIQLLERNNQGSLQNAILIALLPLLIVLAMWASSEPLRKARWRPIWIDVGVTAGCIALFQVVFYFFGRRWRYAGTVTMIKDVCEEYRKTSGLSNVVPDCGSCSDKVQNVLNRSPTVARLRQGLDDPAGIRNITVGQMLDLLKERAALPQVNLSKDVLNGLVGPFG